MFNGIFNHEARLFTDNYELSGINSLEFSYKSSSDVKNILGSRRGFSINSGPIQQGLTLNRNLIYNDPVLNYTGSEPIAASLFYNDSYYGFEKGYLNNYSLSCAVGAVPKSASNFIITDEMKSGVDAGGKRTVRRHPKIDIPSQGSIAITCDNSTTNRVVGFNYAININRKPIYGIGQKDPFAVETIAPIFYTANASIDVDDAFLQNSYNFLELKENKNLSIIVNGRDGKELQSVNIPNASLINETLRISQDGSLKLDLNYVGHG